MISQGFSSKLRRARENKLARTRFATRRTNGADAIETLARRRLPVSNFRLQGPSLGRPRPLTSVFDGAVPSSRSVDSQMCH